jgi:hypothetical protein
MAGSRDRPDCWRGGPLELDLEAYGSLYDTGGARGTSGAAGIDSFMAPVVGGGMCWLTRRRCDEALETPLVPVAAANGRAVLLGIAPDMAADASTGRRYEELRLFC